MAENPKPEIHSLLARQLKRHRDDPTDIPDAWRPFLDAVNEAYCQNDSDGKMMGRSLELSSQELLEANSTMRNLIGELKENERERERLIKELEAKNEEMEQFTYTLTHDLRAPVVTIQGFLQYLRQDMEAGDAARLENDLRRIQTAAAQIASILGEISDLIRIGKVFHDLEEVDTSEIVEEAVSLVAGQIVEGGVEIDVAADLPVVMGERPRLLQVFQNLIENAVKFMGDQGAPRIEIFVRTDGNKPVLCVRDNGRGIDPHNHHKIFGLFDRLSIEDQGSGIGLTLVKRVVEAHGGHVWVESEGEGMGSTFCLTLPAG